jgi:hypothetical protein
MKQRISIVYNFFKIQKLEVLQDIFWCNNDCTLNYRQREGVVNVLAYHCTSNYRMEQQVC